MCVFNDNDGVIDNDPQGKNETEHHDHVHRKTHPRKDHVGNEDGKRDRHGYKKGVVDPHKEHQDQCNQDKSDHNGVVQLFQGASGKF